ncbi:MAG: hypothetical protein CTY35_02065 [Methylotenera sp.]|uniref:hypothetical protein n=1 Tax=Methylotenera sp. TaxID=2051956 RepID=UPI000D42003D|nr:hypothetical protein [Methylotenera sp.]PPC84410.1 MAG: hypothetical protein CTY38_02285 [Methylotenera sp.]PPD01051.1 MAG: hypothetical protein CTY35_02065 [Methylotenera sp.]
MSSPTKKTFKKPPSVTALRAVDNANSEEADKFINSGSATSAAGQGYIKTPAPAVSEQDDEMPWMTSDPSLRTQHISRLPVPLKQLIDHLGDTIKGKNQNSITIEGLTAVAAELAKKKGIPLPDNWGQWLKK